MDKTKLEIGQVWATPTMSSFAFIESFSISMDILYSFYRASSPDLVVLGSNYFCSRKLFQKELPFATTTT